MVELEGGGLGYKPHLCRPMWIFTHYSFISYVSETSEEMLTLLRVGGFLSKFNYRKKWVESAPPPKINVCNFQSTVSTGT